MGCWILARPKVAGKSRESGHRAALGSVHYEAPIYLTVIYAMADNNGLFWGFRVRLLS